MTVLPTRLPSLLLTLLVSAFLHALAFVFWGFAPTTLPELIPSQPGVASIKLVASESSRTQPPPKTASELPADLPTPPDLSAALIPLAVAAKDDVTPMPPRTEPIERPRDDNAREPKLTSKTKMLTPVDIPDWSPDLVHVKSPALNPVKPPDSNKSLAPIARPQVDKPLPRLETATKVAELASAPSQGSEESQGAVEDLPQKLPFNIPPPYPAEALAAGQQGNVTLRAKIDAAGKVTTVSVYTSSGYKSLDNSALTAVRRWLFSPARRGGRPVPFEVLVPIEFSIRR